ncbi:helix-turn-helix domain-containing protein [Aureimonas sp. ME7]|uniref:helix-turn-helix domain-containing protein n=1 Tax=Aureimonas sp. ME7 TaxID=2744252 RepID=UPI0015F439BA|nr:helix-turn-helix domain-containing protein [Aureimonas sp. ME7]
MQREHGGDEWAGPTGTFLIERHAATAMASAHWHDHVEVNLLLEGRMTYLFNGRREAVEAGRLVLFWAAIPHQTIEVTGPAPLVCIYLPLADFLALPLEKQDRQSIMQGQFLTEIATEAQDATQVPRWEREWRSGSAARRRLVVEEIRLRVRRLIIDHAETEQMAPSTSVAPSVGAAIRHVEALTELISDRYAEPLNVTDLANLASIHPSTANTAFRNVLGLSVNQYLTRYRVARAMQLLTDSDTAVMTIGFDCGFGSSSRFYDVFKSQTGTTPRQFRESIGSIKPPKTGDSRKLHRE